MPAWDSRLVPSEIWRITSARHSARAFDGEGARLYGGRWDYPGTPVVYTSRTLSLCALEYFVHLEPELAPKDLIAIRVEVPPDASVASIEVAGLPPDWRAYPAPDALKDLGTVWARRLETALLSVPSAIIPHERNYLLNPAHSDFGRIRVLPAEPFAFDPRMWKG